ncbi:MAG: hypothetical protein M0R37_10600 [Bacteroidales bacterium]|nr:hypothetical protein [Bacteroidales bacterium]
MTTKQWARRAIALLLIAALVLVSTVDHQVQAQSGGNYFDDVTVGGDLDIYGTGVIRDTDDDTVQAAATSGRWTLAGNATSANLYAGATGNAVAAGLYGATIAGGGTGVTGDWGTSGTFYNIINYDGDFSTIGGGLKNTVSGGYAVVGGGQSHTIEQAAWWGTIGGGQINRVRGPYGVVAGGFGNTSHNGGAVLGGTQNTALAQYSGSVAGYRNEIDSVASMGWIGGGYCNTVGTGNACLGSTNPFNRITVGGGTGTYSLVAGGDRNAVNGYSDSILNGFFNTVSNEVTATVTGVYTSGVYYEWTDTPMNSVEAEYDFDTSVATCNTAHNSILGGSQNTIANAGILTYTQIISAYSEITPALVVGCYSGYGLVGTGVSNTITGTTAQYTTILNGFDNEASGRYSTILNGYQARAVGEYSLASGRYARALHDGAFVWADGEDAVYSSTVANSFNVRAGGGVTLTTSGAGLSLDGPVIVDGMAFTYTNPITISGVLTNVRLLFYQVP